MGADTRARLTGGSYCSKLERLSTVTLSLTRSPSKVVSQSRIWRHEKFLLWLCGLIALFLSWQGTFAKGDAYAAQPPPKFRG